MLWVQSISSRTITRWPMVTQFTKLKTPTKLDTWLDRMLRLQVVAATGSTMIG
jgi:hypothetical protein